MIDMKKKKKEEVLEENNVEEETINEIKKSKKKKVKKRIKVKKKKVVFIPLFILLFIIIGFSSFLFYQKYRKDTLTMIKNNYSQYHKNHPKPNNKSSYQHYLNILKKPTKKLL